MSDWYGAILFHYFMNESNTDALKTAILFVSISYAPMYCLPMKLFW